MMSKSWLTFSKQELGDSSSNGKLSLKCFSTKERASFIWLDRSTCFIPTRLTYKIIWGNLNGTQEQINLKSVKYQKLGYGPLVIWLG